MATAAIELLTHPEQLEAMAAAGRQRAQKLYCSTRIIPQYVDYYEKVLAQ